MRSTFAQSLFVVSLALGNAAVYGTSMLHWLAGMPTLHAPSPCRDAQPDKPTREQVKLAIRAALSRQGRAEASPAPSGCEDCVLVDTEQDPYCEDRPGQDCGVPINWFDDDYKWERDVNIYRCPPNNVQYRACGVWQRQGCCPSGSIGQPDPACGQKNGRLPCSKRPRSAG